MGRHVQRGFALRVAGLEHDLRVVRLRGRERINALYRWDLDLVTSRRVAADQRALLGRAAALTLSDGEGPARVVHGIIASQRVDGRPAPDDLRRLSVRLVPRMWLLGQRARSRVFHRISPLALAASVLRSWSIDVEPRVTGRLAVLEHCVQHRETDLAFVERVLARHGLAWWFAHPEAEADDTSDDTSDATHADLGGVTIASALPHEGPDATHLRERVVIADRAERYDPMRTLSFASASDDLVHGAHDVRAFAVEARVRPTAARVLFYQPSRFQPADATYPEDRADVRSDRAAASRAEASLPLELDDHEAEHAPFDAADPAARAALERARSDATRGDGESGARDLRPGARFELTDHPCVEVNRAWAVTAVDHRGHDPFEREGDAEFTYENRFRCVASTTLSRPRYRRPAPRQVVESATVVGTPADDVYVDASGRIKVRFHWDRRLLTHEDERSCFVRKAEAWAGAGWGAQFTPRPGTEVLVAFLDGDLDQPVVVGALHNERSEQPFPRDERSRRSGVRTHSIGGDGYNELSFNDLAGHEQVRVHAQRDLDELVRHNRSAHVHGSDSVRVGGDSTTHIGGAQTVTIDGHASPLAAKLAVTGNARVDVSKGLLLLATETIVLQCGETRLTITPDDIELNTCGGASVSLLGAAVDIHGQRVDVSSNTEIDMQAELIKLNS